MHASRAQVKIYSRTITISRKSKLSETPAFTSNDQIHAKLKLSTNFCVNSNKIFFNELLWLLVSAFIEKKSGKLGRA